MTRSKKDHDVNEVFGRLRTVENEISGLRTEIATISANQASGNQLLAEIRAAQQARASTDWKALAAWSAVIVTVITLYTSQNITPIKEQANLNSSAISRILDRQADSAAIAAGSALEQGRYRERVDSLARDVARIEAWIDEDRRRD